MILVFDTETTGLANFDKPSTDNCQPRIVQLGAILYDDGWVPRIEINAIVRPVGMDIPIAASNIHGITTAIATDSGVDEPTVLNLFHAMASKANVVVAHNINFDRLVIERAWAANHISPYFGFTQKCYCTMQATTQLCKLPAKWGKGYKWPKLQEAYRHAFQEDFEGAHDAMSDVRACARLYRWLIEGKNVK